MDVGFVETGPGALAHPYFPPDRWTPSGEGQRNRHRSQGRTRRSQRFDGLTFYPEELER